jgi:hypothetical protein
MIITPSYSFNRATGTTQYGQNELVANHATAANVVPMKFSLQRVGGNGLIKGVRLYKSATSVTAAIFNIWLFDADPGVPTNGDNGAFGVASAANVLAQVSIDMSSGSLAGGTSYAFKRSSSNLDIGVNVGTDGFLWGLLSTGTSGTYTPADSETFKVVLEIERNT